MQFFYYNENLRATMSSQLTFTKSKYLNQVIFITLMSASASSYAVNFGETTIQSAQNQPLSATIDVSNIADTSKFKVALAKGRIYNQMGLTANSNITATFQPTSKTSGKIILRSSRPIKTAFADVVFDIKNNDKKQFLPKTLLMPISEDKRIDAQAPKKQQQPQEQVKAEKQKQSGEKAKASQTATAKTQEKAEKKTVASSVAPANLPKVTAKAETVAKDKAHDKQSELKGIPKGEFAKVTKEALEADKAKKATQVANKAKEADKAKTKEKQATMAKAQKPKDKILVPAIQSSEPPIGVLSGDAVLIQELAMQKEIAAKKANKKQEKAKSASKKNSKKAKSNLKASAKKAQQKVKVTAKHQAKVASKQQAKKAKQQARVANKSVKRAISKGQTKYVVQRNDNLWTIANAVAKRNKTSVQKVMTEIKQHNPRAFSGNVLLANRTLVLPAYNDVPSKTSLKKAVDARRANLAKKSKKAKQKATTVANSKQVSAKKAQQKAVAKKAQQKVAAEKAQQRAAAKKAQQRAAAKKAQQRAAAKKAQQRAAAKKAQQRAAAKKAQQRAAAKKAAAKQAKVSLVAKNNQGKKSSPNSNGSTKKLVTRLKKTRKNTADKMTKVKKLNTKVGSYTKKLQLQNKKLAELEARLKKLKGK